MNIDRNDAIQQRDLAVLWHPTTHISAAVSEQAGRLEHAMGGIALATKN